MKHPSQQHPSDEAKPSSAFRVGAIALVFLVIGFQIALFVYRSAVTALVAHRDRPDTVYVSVPVPAPPAPAGPASAPAAPSSAPAAPAPAPSAATTPASSDVILSGSEGSPSPQPSRRDAPHSPEAREIHRAFSPRVVESFPFDPNTAGEDELMRLGFSQKQAQSIIHYREKGGRFHRKEDFARSYVVSDTVYARLAPYIRIPKVDLNTADSAAFDALPGIGPYYAAQMVAYRQRLGGYSFPEQLMDLWKFDRERYEGLSDLVTVSHPYRFPLWTFPEDSLKQHPYLDAHSAHGIVLFRAATPESEWTVENLVSAGILPSDRALKLARCVAAP